MLARQNARDIDTAASVGKGTLPIDRHAFRKGKPRSGLT